MSADFQASLFGGTHVGVGPLVDRVERTVLSRGAWVDLLPGWFEGADPVFEELASAIPWRAERRPMYDGVVDVPRLLHTYGIGDPLPHPALVEARDALSAYYAPELGEPFVTAGCCYYRDGRDSVAWHGDTIGRGRSADTMVAIGPSARRASCSCAPSAARSPSATPSATVTSSSWAARASAPGSTRSPRPHARSAPGSACSSAPATSSDLPVGSRGP